MQAGKENSSWCGFQRVYGMHTVWKLESCSTVLLFYCCELESCIVVLL